MQWIKSMGKKLFTGSFNLINTPFPVSMFEPRSYLAKLADVWVSIARHSASICERAQGWFVCMTAAAHGTLLACKHPLSNVLFCQVYPRFLQMASETTDPLERMRLVVTWFVAGNEWRALMAVPHTGITSRTLQCLCCGLH